MYEQISRNKRRTVLLIVGTVVVVGALGYLFGLLLNIGPVGLVVAVLIAEFMLRWFWWGGGAFGGRGRRREGGEGGNAFAILAVVGLVLAILTPIIAQVIKMAMSRRREYLADAEGALLTRYPPGLASALKKIAADTTPMRVANNATAHLWINQPSRVPGQGSHWFESLFSTHPPIQDRIRILEEM